jgi:FAD/FMN-containing dehydrogenase
MLSVQQPLRESNPAIQANPGYARLYATDASVYEQVPSGVDFPRVVEDCVALVYQAREQGTSLICRGGGTSIAGQCVGAGSKSIYVEISGFFKSDRLLGHRHGRENMEKTHHGCK